MQRRLAPDFSRRSVLTAWMPTGEGDGGLTLTQFDISWASRSREQVLRRWMEEGNAL